MRTDSNPKLKMKSSNPKKVAVARLISPAILAVNVPLLEKNSSKFVQVLLVLSTDKFHRLYVVLNIEPNSEVLRHKVALQSNPILFSNTGSP